MIFHTNIRKVSKLGTQTSTQSPSRIEFLAKPVNNDAKADIKFLWFCLILLDFVTFDQIFCQRLQAETISRYFFLLYFRIVFHGIRAKLVPNWGRNMLYTKIQQIFCGEMVSTLTGLKESSLACKCVFYRPERNPKGEPHGVEF